MEYCELYKIRSYANLELSGSTNGSVLNMDDIKKSNKEIHIIPQTKVLEQKEKDYEDLLSFH